MFFPFNYLLWLIGVFFGGSACSQRQDTHMNWIAKFDFFDLYQTRVSDGYFNPGSAITIKHIAIPYENTIILAATKLVSLA